MSFWSFKQPTQWGGYRDIDQVIDVDAIQKEQNYEEDAADEEVEQETESLANADNKKQEKEGSKITETAKLIKKNQWC